MAEICRICLQETVVPNFTEITNDVASIQIKHEILLCIPEVDLNLLRNPILCTTCLNSLNTFYKFKKYCLHIEERIRSYMHTANNPAEVTIKDVYKSNILTGLALHSALPVKNKDVVNPERTYIDDLNDLLDEALQGKEPSINGVGINFQPVAVKQEESETNESLSSLVCDTVVNSTEKISSENPVLSNSVTHVKKTHSCKLCSFTTAYLSSLYVHTKRHKTDTVFQCHKCSFRALGVPALQKHSNAVHFESAVLVKPVKRTNEILLKKSVVKCQKCNFTSESTGALKVHLRDEHNRELHMCQICKKITTTESHLKQHMVTRHATSFNNDSTEKDFKCKLCSYTTSNKHSYAGHMGSHKYPKKCTLCDYSTTVPHHLNQHYIRKHKTKPPIVVNRTFACKLCPFQPASRRGLVSHIQHMHKKSN